MICWCCEVVLSLLDSDLYHVLRCVALGRLPSAPLQWRSGEFWTSVVLVTKPYPEAVEKGKPILGSYSSFVLTENLSDCVRYAGLTEVGETKSEVVLHAGTAVTGDGRVVTSGGRVLNVLASGASLRESRDAATRLAAALTWDGVDFRRDIGLQFVDSR